MKNIILVKNLNDDEDKKKITRALAETRVEYEINVAKGCVIVEGNYDMVVVAKKIILELGYRIL